MDGAETSCEKQHLLQDQLDVERFNASLISGGYNMIFIELVLVHNAI